MTEKEKMLQGKAYDPSDKELTLLRQKAHRLNNAYNSSLETEDKKREEILKEFGIEMGRGSFLQGPIYFDYGCFIRTGKNFYANFNFTCLDTCPITIGDNVFIGPNVSLYTAMHSLLPIERNSRFRPNGEMYDIEYGKPIAIGDNVWIAGSVSIGPGVHIGSGSVIGAGSVVIKDIPEGVLAAGNPCKVIRPLTQEDSWNKKNLF